MHTGIHFSDDDHSLKFLLKVPIFFKYGYRTGIEAKITYLFPFFFEGWFFVVQVEPLE